MSCSLLRSLRQWCHKDDQALRWRLTLLALSPLARASKRPTVGPPGRQRPCSMSVAAVDVFGQLSMAHATCWSGGHYGMAV